MEAMLTITSARYCSSLQSFRPSCQHITLPGASQSRRQPTNLSQLTVMLMLEGQQRLKASCVHQRKPVFLVLVRHRLCWLVRASPRADLVQGQKLADVPVQHGMSRSQRRCHNSS